MEPLDESQSQLHNHQLQHPDSHSHSHSHPSIDNDNNLAQIIAQDLQNLVLSSNDDAILPNTLTHSVVANDEDQARQSVDDDVNEVVVQGESSSGSVEIERRRMEEVVEADPNDSRVLEERESDDEEDVSSEIGEFENNEDEQRGKIGNVGGDDGKVKDYHYPLRLDAEDCAYYIRTGMCKFGSSCKFNHPLRRKNQPLKETKKQQQQVQSKKQKEGNLERHGPTECKPTKETKKQKEENIERHGQIECKHHTSSAGCKYGKACKFNHGRGKTVKTPVVDYNFVGLPIRPGEKECPYYMRNGSCKYGPSCRFNHPDPTAVGGDDAPTTYRNDGPPPIQHAPQPNIPSIPSWSAPRPPEPTAAFVPMMYPQTQNMPPQNLDWNGYQAPPVPAPVPSHLYPSSDQGLPIPPAFFLNNPPSNTNMYTPHQQPMSVSEYPERPGQPECSYYLKTGVCKYRASCKFHHPQSRISRPVRDKNICAYFSRHGTCKFGPACKYDHPVNYNSNSNPAREGYDGSNGRESLIQQSV